MTTLAERAGWLPTGTFAAARHILLATGAVVVGLATAWASEALSRLGRIDRNAALAVVFTTAFAAGLLLLRWQADAVHIDPDHVLFGEVELSVLDTVPGTSIPRPLVVAAAALAINLVFAAVCWKELRVASFDPAYAESIGINTGRLHLVQVAVTAVTLVAAFESVGSILAIAMLVLPAATARFLSHRLVGTLVWSIGLASSFCGCGSCLVVHAASSCVWQSWLRKRRRRGNRWNDGSGRGVLLPRCAALRTRGRPSEHLAYVARCPMRVCQLVLPQPRRHISALPHVDVRVPLASPVRTAIDVLLKSTGGASGTQPVFLAVRDLLAASLHKLRRRFGCGRVPRTPQLGSVQNL